MNRIPQDFEDLLTSKKAFAHLATMNADGWPQVTPMWFDYDGTHIIFNSALGRLKDRNLRRDPRVVFAIQDPENPYRYIQMRGRVIEITEEGADASIDRLAHKYLGLDRYPFAQPGEKRVMYRVEIAKVQTKS